MKILIPTDFSKLSKVAVQYAAKMAKKVDAEIVLLHVVFIPEPPQTMHSAKSIEEIMAENAEADLIQLEQEIKAAVKGHLNISHEVVKGFPVEDVVDNYARHNDIDLIVMGTKGATGLAKVLIGSNATAVINSSQIPVITVPEHARFDHLHSMVYATDMTALDEEVQTALLFARIFDANLHILHVLPAASKEHIDKNKVLEHLKTKMNYPKMTFQIAINDDTTEGINDYIADIKADILVMFTRERTFFEKIFGKSVTREMAFHSWVPILAIKK